MKINVVWGTGEGKTKKAAFDRALMDAGIEQYNLIPLSSVIPPGSEIILGEFSADPREYGHRLYVVLSESYAEGRGMNAASGLGWRIDGDGKGIFVEVSGSDAAKVKSDILETFDSITKSRHEDAGDINMKLIEKTCNGNIVCVIVAAVYKSEGWE